MFVFEVPSGPRSGRTNFFELSVFLVSPFGLVSLGLALERHTTESLILAQNERWRRGLGMQVERESRTSVWRVEWRTGE